MFKAIKSFFASLTTKKPEFLVIFDGDQVGVKNYRKFMNVKTDRIKHIWVQCHKTIPKVITKSEAEIRVAPNFGKESTDNLMYLLASAEATQNKALREVHIVSADGDMIDMSINLAQMHPNVTFYTIHIGNRPLKKGALKYARLHAPSNCNFVITKGY